MNAHKIKPTKMKKILTVLLLGLSMTMNSQWIKGEKKDAFDGNYKYTIVKGYGGDFPYATPSLTINRFANETPNIYISDMGSMACDNQILKIAIDDKIYSFNLSSSVDGDSGFLQGTNNEMIMLLNGLKKGNKAILRFTTRCSVNTFKIGLTGSTSGINYVVGNYYVKKRESLLASEKIKLDSIKAVNDAIMPKYLEWKSNIDKDIRNIYDNYVIRDKYDKSEIFSFEDFKRICYKKIDDPYKPSSDSLLYLLNYYKSYNIGHRKNYNNFLINQFYIKTKMNKYKKINEYELIVLRVDGDNHISGIRDRWVIEKKMNINEDKTIEKNKLNNNKTCTFEKSYYGGDEFSVKGTVTFGENYLLIDIGGKGVDNVKIPILDENIKTNSSKWTFNYTANDITITYIFNAADYTYNTSGGTLTLKNSGSVKDIIYPLILSYTKKPFNPKKLP